LAGLEEEVVEEELLVERSKPPPPQPPPPPPPPPLLLCLMPLSSMAWPPPPPPPPVTSFHNCWSSAGLRPAGGIWRGANKRDEAGKEREERRGEEGRKRQLNKMYTVYWISTAAQRKRQKLKPELCKLYPTAIIKVARSGVSHHPIRQT